VEAAFRDDILSRTVPSNDRADPPGPPGLPLVGHLPDFARDPLGFFERSARQYGDVVRLRIVGWEAWLLAHPDHVRQVLVRDPGASIKHTFFWRHVRRIFGHGLLTNEGESWLHQRRLIQPAFHHERIARYGETMVDHTLRRLEEWRPGGVIHVREEMTGLTFRIVAKTLFDADVEDDVARIRKAFDVGVEEVAARFRRPVRIPDWIPTPGNLRYLRAVRRMDRLIARMIDEHRAPGAEGDDLLGALMRARDERGRAMSDRQLRDETITMLLAGHETTALSLTWTLWLLATHPEVDATVAEEVNGVLGDRPPGPDDLERMPALRRAIHESLRLYPPAYSFGRETVEDLRIGPWTAPAGTTLFVFPWILHRDSRFFPDPLVYRPDRWTEAFERDLHPQAFIPFGAGPRHCIGHGFAMMELGLILATILQRYRLSWLADAPRPFTSITLRPVGGLEARLAPR